MGSSYQVVFGVFEGHSEAKVSQYCWDSLRFKLDNAFDELKIDPVSTVAISKYFQN